MSTHACCLPEDVQEEVCYSSVSKMFITGIPQQVLLMAVMEQYHYPKGTTKHNATQ